MVRTPDISRAIDLRTGRVLGVARGRRLLHFMTGGCINCLHLLAELRAASLPSDLEVVTIHSGKFPREREEAYVRRFAQTYRLDHPVINDADGSLRDAFAVGAWPTLVLVSASGYELGRRSGEGSVAPLLEIAEPKVGVLSPQSGGVLGVALSSDGAMAVARDGEILLWMGEGERAPRRLKGWSEPRGLLFHGGRLYVTDRAEGTVWAVDLPDGARRSLGEGFRSPWGVETDGSGLVVAEAGGHRLIRFDFAHRRWHPLAGLGHEGVREGEALTEALFAQPTGLARLAEALYVADAEGSALRRIEQGCVETPVGWDLFTFGDRDGMGEEVRLQHPEGLCAGIGGCGNYRIFIADTYNDKVKVYDPLTDRVQSLVEELSLPTAVAKRGCALYIGDAEGLMRFDLSAMTQERIPLP